MPQCVPKRNHTTTVFLCVCVPHFILFCALPITQNRSNSMERMNLVGLYHVYNLSDICVSVCVCVCVCVSERKRERERDTFLVVTGYAAAINPFTAPVCKTSGLKSACTRLQTVYFPVLQQIYWMLCILMKILGIGIKKIVLLLVIFKWYGSERMNNHQSCHASACCCQLNSLALDGMFTQTNTDTWQ